MFDFKKFNDYQDILVRNAKSHPNCPHHSFANLVAMMVEVKGEQIINLVLAGAWQIILATRFENGDGHVS